MLSCLLPSHVYRLGSFLLIHLQFKAHVNSSCPVWLCAVREVRCSTSSKTKALLAYNEEVIILLLLNHCFLHFLSADLQASQFTATEAQSQPSKATHGATSRTVSRTAQPDACAALSYPGFAWKPNPGRMRHSCTRNAALRPTCWCANTSIGSSVLDS